MWERCTTDSSRLNCIFAHCAILDWVAENASESKCVKKWTSFLCVKRMRNIFRVNNRCRCSKKFPTKIKWKTIEQHSSNETIDTSHTCLHCWQNTHHFRQFSTLQLRSTRNCLWTELNAVPWFIPPFVPFILCAHQHRDTITRCVCGLLHLMCVFVYMRVRVYIRLNWNAKQCGDNEIDAKLKQTELIYIYTYLYTHALQHFNIQSLSSSLLLLLFIRIIAFMKEKRKIRDKSNKNPTKV